MELSVQQKGLNHTQLPFFEPFSLNEEHHLEGSTNTTNASWSFICTSESALLAKYVHTNKEFDSGRNNSQCTLNLRRK